MAKKKPIQKSVKKKVKADKVTAETIIKKGRQSGRTSFKYPVGVVAEPKLRETSIMVGCSGGRIVFQDIENSGRVLALDGWDSEKVRKFFYEN